MDAKSVKRPIAVLPPALQNQIAAGEVVERPSSVIKELVENSLDAQADLVRVEIEGGGRTLIMVQDNGCGMTPEEIPLALTRHATNKISSIQDLSTIGSFGFRGEALPSIASISDCTVSSKTQNMQEAFFVRVVNGRTVATGPAALATGTRIEVRDLFAVVPARLNFLKTEGTETKRCGDIFCRLALAHPGVDMEFVQSGRRMHHFSKGRELLDRLRTLWPPAVTEALLPVANEHAGIRVRGYCGAPGKAQPRPDRILLYVNSRPVQDKMLLRALREAYRGFLIRGEHPQAALFIDLDPKLVDVNTHPAKAEVRFREEKTVFSILYHGVRQALQTQATIGPGKDGFPFSRGWKPTTPGLKTQERPLEIERPKFQAARETAAMFGPMADAPPSFAPPKPPSPEDRAHGPRQALGLEDGSLYLGQVDRTYLVVAEPHGLLLIDQHAAHERILYQAMRTGTVEKRPLAMPVSLDLHPAESEEMQRISPELKRLGFEFRFETQEKILLTATPAWLSAAGAAETLKALAGGQGKTRDDILVTLACHRAIKAGDSLDDVEAAQLLRQWWRCPERSYCPHGRPAAVRFQRTDLDKLFKRIK